MVEATETETFAARPSALTIRGYNPTHTQPKREKRKIIIKGKKRHYKVSYTKNNKNKNKGGKNTLSETLSSTELSLLFLFFGFLSNLVSLNYIFQSL